VDCIKEKQTKTRKEMSYKKK